MKIVVCDPISPKGIALLQQWPEFQVVVLPKRLPEAELLPLVADAVALVVRSETKVTRKVIEAAPKLRVVGRAGVGVDNVDIEAATQHGTVVMNTPGGNTVTTAELSFAMLLSLARKVPQAHATMVAGKWDRKLFQGAELAGKTLGGAHQAREQAAPLQQIKAAHLQRQHAAADERRGAQCAMRYVGRLGAKQHHAEQGEADLREGLQGGAHRDGGGGIRKRQAAPVEMADHQHRAADQPGGQQAIGRFARPSRQQGIAHAAARRRGVN